MIFIDILFDNFTVFVCQMFCVFRRQTIWKKYITGFCACFEKSRVAATRRPKGGGHEGLYQASI